MFCHKAYIFLLACSLVTAKRRRPEKGMIAINQATQTRMPETVSHRGAKTASPTDKASSTNQQTQRMMLKVRSIMAASLTLGKAVSGTGLLRNLQSGGQPSFTSNTSSLSGGTCLLTSATWELNTSTASSNQPTDQPTDRPTGQI